MKRYRWCYIVGTMAEDPDGKFVLHSDVLKEKVEEARMRVVADKAVIKIHTDEELR